jgi:alpha-1,3-glucan synthase
MLNLPPFFSGRGRTPDQRPPGFGEAITSPQTTTSISFERLRSTASIPSPSTTPSTVPSRGSLDWTANLQVGYDIPINFVDAWNTLFVENDFINAFTGEIDPRHMYGLSNFDILRWDGLVNGTQKSTLGTFIASLLLPGAPLVSFIPFWVRTCCKLM